MVIEKRVLKVLHLEDSEDDAVLARRTLERAGMRVSFERVDSVAGFEKLLESEHWDLVLSEYEFRKFAALEALRAFSAHIKANPGSELPFIVLAGPIGEEAVAEMMRHGAHDYISKKRISLLVAAVTRELPAVRARSHIGGQTAARLPLMFEAAPDPVLLTTHDGRIVEMNSAALDLLGHVQPAEHELSIGKLECWSRKEEVAEILRRQAAGLMVRNAEVGVSLASDNGRNNADRLFIWSIEHLELETLPHLVWYGRDITELRQAEQLRIKQRTSLSTQSFATGVCRDLARVLTAVQAATERVAQRVSGDPSLSRYNRSASHAAAAGLSVISRIKHLSAPAGELPGPTLLSVSLNEVLRETLLRWEQAMPERLRIRARLQADVRLKTNPDALQQVLQALFENASDATAESDGEILLETKDLAGLGESEQRVCISIADHGPGIEPEELERVFDPYYTTKTPEFGTGLSLSIAAAVAGELDGKLTLSSTPGEGTRALLTLPCNASE